jgi:CrcB protein
MSLLNNSYLGQALLVGLGGFLGSIARFLLSGIVDKNILWGAFPYGTLTVNALGCFAIGILGGLIESRDFLSPEQRIFLLIGLLGGFTTFSTFAYQTLGLFNASDLMRAGLNATLHVLICLILVWVGHQIIRYI